jgi:acetyl-CoA carboxylase biotin carboxylase subunit
MIGKLIAHAENRAMAIERLLGALSELVIEGIKTNAELHHDILLESDYRRGGLNIHYLEQKLKKQVIK